MRDKPPGGHGCATELERTSWGRQLGEAGEGALGKVLWDDRADSAAELVTVDELASSAPHYVANALAAAGSPPLRGDSDWCDIWESRNICQVGSARIGVAPM